MAATRDYLLKFFNSHIKMFKDPPGFVLPYRVNTFHLGEEMNVIVRVDPLAPAKRREIAGALTWENNDIIFTVLL